MERRDFFFKAALAGTIGAAFPATLLAIPELSEEKKNIEPVLLPSQPPLQHNGGMDIRVWVRNSMTSGLYSNVECAVAPKTMGPPPHYHLELDELMYVVEGTAHILIGDEVVEVKAGGWHLRPRMIKHTFWNASAEPLRFFDMYFNQPFEVYLEKIFHEFTPENGYIEGSEMKNTAIGKLNDEFGLVFPSDSFDQKDEIVRKYGLR
jgi:mannose-6-phosphate isomerase-like protein (cupin superfamily)